MNCKKMLKNSLREIETPTKESVLGTAAVQKPDVSKKKKWHRRLSLTPVLAVFLCILLVGCTAAIGIPMLINYMNAKALTENLRQLDSVPEGYVGIYTAEDLNNIRNLPKSNYILMNDITFSDEDFLEGGRFEGGFVPIGSEEQDESNTESPVFSGIFNGNGYVIKNIKVAPAALLRTPSFGIFGQTRGQFINLGVEDIEIDIDFLEADFYTDETNEYIFVGGIAASADFIGGCYVRDAKINISLENYFHGKDVDYSPYKWGNASLYVGGITGACDYLDSCIADAKISVIGEKDFSVYSGLLSGDAFSVITSITTGAISVDGADCNSVSVDRIASLLGGVSMPSILDENAMETLLTKIDAYYLGGETAAPWETNFKASLFRGYYLKLSSSHDNDTKADTRRIHKEYIEINQTFGYVNIDSPNYEGDLYILDRHLVGAEAGRIVEIVTEVFGSFEAFLEFCNENGIKCGVVSSYSFDKTEDVSAETLENFDFEKIFVEKDGKVILRIFNN